MKDDSSVKQVKPDVQMKVAKTRMSNSDRRNSEWCRKLVPTMRRSMSEACQM